MAETLVTADAEAAVIAEYAVRMPALGYAQVKAGTKIPAGTKPADFLRVLVVGGVNRDIANDQITLAIEGWSTGEVRAQRLTAIAVAALDAAGRDGSVGGVASSSVQVLSIPQNLPDPNVPTHYRYTSTVSVTLRRAAV